MESSTCNKCRQKSLVPPHFSIRCFGCNTLISVGSMNDSTIPKTETEGKINFSSYYVNYKGIQAPRKKKKPPLISSLQTTTTPPPISICAPSRKSREAAKTTPPPISTRAPPRNPRRALVCGVAYKKTKHKLKGTAQDVKNMCSLLQREYGFLEESILVLSEEDGYHDPTRRNIEEGFEWLMRGIRAGDSLLFYFSGHGMRQREYNNDESYGFDKAICPLDFENSGMIVDNYINQAIVRPLVKGVVLHAIIDSCHSGSVLDLPCVYDMKGRKWEDNSPPSGIYRGTKGGKAICFSACEYYQMAADTSALSLDKEMTGVMTTAFMNAIRGSILRNDNITYHELMESMHHQIKQASQSGGYFAGIRRISQPTILQDPQLSSSERFDPHTEFKL